MTFELATYYCHRCTSRWQTSKRDGKCPFCHAMRCERIQPDSPFWRHETEEAA